MACNGKNLTKQDINKLLRFLKARKYIIYEKPYQLNIIGVRDTNTTPEKFDDKLNVIWKNDNGNWEGIEYAITTDPSIKWLNRGGAGEFEGLQASAVLPSGQYVNTFKLGYHKGNYLALTQAKDLCVYRDYDRNALLDFNTTDITCGMFGINIHRAKSGGADDGQGNTSIIGDYSAGCQVFQNYYCFGEFMSLVEKNKSMYGNEFFTYTLIDKWLQKQYAIKRIIYIGGILVSLFLIGYGYYLMKK